MKCAFKKSKRINFSIYVPFCEMIQNTEIYFKVRGLHYNIFSVKVRFFFFCLILVLPPDAYCLRFPLHKRSLLLSLVSNPRFQFIMI